jgi:hypothetical protein
MAGAEPGFVERPGLLSHPMALGDPLHYLRKTVFHRPEVPVLRREYRWMHEQCVMVKVLPLGHAEGCFRWNMPSRRPLRALPDWGQPSWGP